MSARRIHPSLALAITLSLLLSPRLAHAANPACGSTITINGTQYNLGAEDHTQGCASSTFNGVHILGSPSGLADTVSISPSFGFTEFWVTGQTQFDATFGDDQYLECEDPVQAGFFLPYTELISSTFRPTFGGAGPIVFYITWGTSELDYGTIATVQGRSTDLNSDGDTDEADESLMRAEILVGTNFAYDLNWDSQINATDLGILLAEARRRDSNGERYGRGHCVQGGGGGDPYIVDYSSGSLSITPPSAPTNLTVTGNECGVYLLRFRTGGDDDTVGTAYQYLIRTSTSAITMENFATATPVTTLTPYTTGSWQFFQTSVATSTSSKYFAILAIDDSGEPAGSLCLSGAVSVPETTAPATTSGATASRIAGGGAAGQARVRWTSAGDDGTTGTPAYYDVRVSSSAINSGNFAAALQFATPTGVSAGTLVTVYYPMEGCDETYYFAIRTVDDHGNCSGVSNSPSATGFCQEEGLAGGDETEGTAIPAHLSLEVHGVVSEVAEFAIGIPARLSGVPAEITVHDVLGRRVARPLHAPLSPGQRTIRWNLTSESGQRIPIGVYAVRFVIGNETRAAKFSVVR